MSLNFQLVKMDGDFAPRPKWWQLHLWVKYRIQGRQVWPKDPKSHPACAEIIEGTDTIPSRVVYRR